VNGSSSDTEKYLKRSSKFSYLRGKEMLKNIAIAVFKRLSLRFTKFQIGAGATLVVLVIVSIVGGLITNAVNVSQYTSLVTRAQSELDSGNLIEAQSYTNQAKSVNISDQSMTAWLDKRIAERLSSENHYTLAFSALARHDLFEAYSQFSKVTKDTKDKFEASQTKMATIRDEALKIALSQSKKYASARNYSDAIAKLTSVQAVMGASNAETLSLLKTYRNSMAAEESARRNRALASMSSKNDAFNNVVWYQDRSSPQYRNSNGFYLYFGVSEGIAQGLRLVVSYFADSWLFVNSARVNVDGTNYVLNADKWERDNNSSIWEWSDVVLDDRQMIERIITSKKAVIRFDGSQYYDTRVISSTQKTALRQVLDAYDNF
jgi:hypothetical protein